MKQDLMQQEVAKLIVDTLNLETTPETIEPKAPLFGEGLGLDSIDALELAYAISKQYGFQLRSDDSENKNIFTNLASLTNHINKNKKCADQTA